MKKVNFTLGLTLAMLFMGVNVINADLLPEDPTKPYNNASKVLPNGTPAGSWRIWESVYVAPSPSWANSTLAGDFGWSDYNDAISFTTIVDNKIDPPIEVVNYSGFEANPYGYTGTTPLDIRFRPFDGVGMGYYGSTTASYLNGLVETTPTTSLIHKIVVKLAYDHGKEVRPFVQRTVVRGGWMYDTETRRNEWTTNAIYDNNSFDLLLQPTKTPDIRTSFTFGTDTAIYTYEYDVLPLWTVYPVYGVFYEIWTNDEIGWNGTGEAHAYPQINRAVRVDISENSIRTSPAIDNNVPVYIPTGSDYSFKVYGQSGKDLIVDSNNRLWTEKNKGLVVEKINAGQWEVTIKSVHANMTVSLGYAPETESALGDGDQTATGVVTEDAVWGSGGTLYVKAANAGTLSIYSMTGQLYKTVSVTGDYTVAMPKGLYIVQLNGKAYKVVL